MRVGVGVVAILNSVVSLSITVRVRFEKGVRRGKVDIEGECSWERSDTSKALSSSLEYSSNNG